MINAELEGDNDALIRPSEEFAHRIRKDGYVTGYSDQDGNRVICPGCKDPVQPKLGENVAKHWAHFPGATCSYSNGETAWHLHWKSFLAPRDTEVPFAANRADMVCPWGCVVENQNSGIASGIIRERCEAYQPGTVSKRGHVLTTGCYFLFNAIKIQNNIIDRGLASPRRVLYTSEDHWLFDKNQPIIKESIFSSEIHIYRWKNPRKPWLAVPQGRMLLDLGDKILLVARHPPLWDACDGPCIVFGRIVTKELFVSAFLQLGILHTLFQKEVIEVANAKYCYGCNSIADLRCHWCDTLVCYCPEHLNWPCQTYVCFTCAGRHTDECCPPPPPPLPPPKDGELRTFTKESIPSKSKLKCLAEKSAYQRKLAEEARRYKERKRKGGWQYQIEQEQRNYVAQEKKKEKWTNYEKAYKGQDVATFWFSDDDWND